VDMLTGKSKEAREPNIFRSNIVCVLGIIVGGESLEVIKNKKE
jgi:hypothetical protein